MENIYDNLDIPQERNVISITRQEAEFIHHFLNDKKIKTSLEVGLAFGCSTAHIIAATNATHYAIDPFQKQDFNNLGLENIRNCGFGNHLRFMNGFSHHILPDLFKEKVKLDFAFIDGSHTFDDIFVDFYYIDMMLNQNAYVLLHDAWMRSTQHIHSWIKQNKKNYKTIKTPVKNLILLQKVGVDNKAWYHFKGFGTYKSLFTNWLYTRDYRKSDKSQNLLSH